MDGGLNTQKSGGSRRKIETNGAHASSCLWHVVTTGFPSNVAEWSGDFLDNFVSARDKGVLRIIAVAALSEVN